VGAPARRTSSGSRASHLCRATGLFSGFISLMRGTEEIKGPEGHRTRTAGSGA
jgi:hypothetical protein